MQIFDIDVFVTKKGFLHRVSLFMIHKHSQSCAFAAKNEPMILLTQKAKRQVAWRKFGNGQNFLF